MTADEAWALLRSLQAAVDARDLDALSRLFHEDVVLIGTSADARDRDAVVAYLTAVTEGFAFRCSFHGSIPFGAS